jgi:hypothetical protein
MIVLFDASIKSGHNFEIFTMRRIALWVDDVQKEPGV